MKSWLLRAFRLLLSMRFQVVLVGLLAVLLAGLVYMAGRTGQDEFIEAREALEAVEAVNLRLDGAVSWSMFEFQMDFDSIADSQSELNQSVEHFYSMVPNASPALSEAVKAKMVAMEDFKTTQSVLRNSRDIASSLIAQLRDQAERAGKDVSVIFPLERDFLNFLSRRDPQSSAILLSTVEQIQQSESWLTSEHDWPVLKNHVLKLVDFVGRIGQVMMAMYATPVPQQIDALLAETENHLTQANFIAGRYRLALFIVAITLLLFSVFMAGRARRYLRLIQRSNDELESRVALRTRELEEVNETLSAEIAERQDVELQLNMARKLEAIGQLAAGIAHEINTPAQYVSDNVAFLEGVWREVEPLLSDYERLVQEGRVDENDSRELLSRTDLPFLRHEVPAAISEAASGLRQVSQIVLAMKTFSHPGTDGIQPADINSALESTVTVARNEWKYVAELTLNLDPELPAVPCDISLLNQVVLNLVVNAAQAIGEVRGDEGGGHIQVSSAQQGDHVEIRVTDDGPGIPKGIQDRIFDPFFTTKDVGKGTGQGLAIAHRVIQQQHGGTLTVESSEGRGATFIIRLPLHVAECDPSELESSSLHEPGNHETGEFAI